MKQHTKRPLNHFGQFQILLAENTSQSAATLDLNRKFPDFLAKWQIKFTNQNCTLSPIALQSRTKQKVPNHHHYNWEWKVKCCRPKLTTRTSWSRSSCPRRLRGGCPRRWPGGCRSTPGEGLTRFLIQSFPFDLKLEIQFSCIRFKVLITCLHHISLS